MDPSRAHAQARGLKLLFVFLVHAVVAVVLLGGLRVPANRTKPRARQNLQLFFPGSSGATCAARRKSAGKRGDDLVRGGGIVLGRVRTRYFQDRSRIL